MKVSSITDKCNGQVNEDSFLITDNLFGVFDGATGLIKYTDENGNTGGFLASQIAKRVFKQNQHESLIPSLETINTEIRKAMKAAGVPMHDKGALWTTGVSIAKVLDTQVEYIQLGDAPIIFIKQDGSFNTLFSDHDLETLKLWKHLVQQGVRDIRHDERMEEQLLKVRRQTNISYGVLNGEPEALAFVLQGTVSKSNLAHILIFSDGMLIPQENPENTENFETIVKLYKEDGLEKVKTFVRNIEDSDPGCLQYPRFKQHDDLTAIAIDF